LHGINQSHKKAQKTKKEEWNTDEHGLKIDFYGFIIKIHRHQSTLFLRKPVFYFFFLFW